MKVASATPPTRPVLSLSTCWNSARHTDGYELLAEIRDLGFGHVELGHGTRLSLLTGLLQGIEKGVVKVGSVHNFCPLPTGINNAAPNLYEPTSPDPEERALWLRYTKKTLDFAARVGAPLAVMHGGSARFWWQPPGERLAKAAGTRTRVELAADARYQAELIRAWQRLEKAAPKYLERLREGLQTIAGYCLEKQVRLAVENREGVEELPLDQGFGAFLREAGEPGWIGYWHDTGHAHLKERLGLGNQRQLLEDNAAHHFGCHLHDATADGRDHQPIGAGTVDWTMVRRFFRPQHTLVLEFSPRLTPEEVVRSREIVEGWLDEQFPAPPSPTP